MNTVFKKLIIVLFLLVAMPSWGALTFDLADDSVDAGSSQDNLSKITITAWVLPTSEGEGEIGTIWIKDAAGTTRKDFRFNGTNQLFFRVGRATAAMSRNSADNTLPNGAWAHVAVVWDGTLTDVTTAIKFYINGVETAYGVGATGSGAITDDNTATEHVGNRAGDTQTWDGRITEFCLWQDNLSANQILGLAKSRVKRSCLQTNPPTLKVYYAMDEIADGKNANAATIRNLKTPGTSDGTADDGANNTGMTGAAEAVVSYPSNF